MFGRLLGELIDLFALLKAHCNAGGILEVRDSVNQLRVGISLELFLELVGVHAVGLNCNADKTGVVGAEGVERADEARSLADNSLALVYKSLCAQVHDLLSACCDEDIIVVAAGVVGFAHVLHHVLSERRVALGDAVLENGDGILAEDTRGNLGDFLCGKGFGRRVARGERYHLGVGGVLENLTYRAGL